MTKQIYDSFGRAVELEPDHFDKNDYYHYEFDIRNGQHNEIPKKLIWNVFVEDLNNRSIKVRNVFDHCSFMNDLYKIKKEEDFGTFAVKVIQSLSYYYWSKSEYEVIITTWPPYIDMKELERLNKEHEERPDMIRTHVNTLWDLKVDIYGQIMLNWDKFINYLWENKKLIKKVK